MTEVELRHQVMLNAHVMDSPLWQGQRITYLLNQAQRWLQLELIKQSYKDWKVPVTLTFSNVTFLGFDVSRATLPTDLLTDVPFISVLSGTANARPARPVDEGNFVDEMTNIFSVPSALKPIFVTSGGFIYVAPDDLTAGTLLYHRLVTDLVYNNDSTNSDIPLEHQNKLIERVEGQIKSINTLDERFRLEAITKIENEIAKRYQLSAIKAPSEESVQDKKVVQ